MSNIRSSTEIYPPRAEVLNMINIDGLLSSANLSKDEEAPIDTIDLWFNAWNEKT